MNQFNPGDKVVCIDDGIAPHTLCGIVNYVPNWIKKNKEYTIRDIEDNDGIAPAVRLAEVHNPPLFIHLLNRTQEPAFAEWRFSLLERAAIETGIEIENLIEA